MSHLDECFSDMLQAFIERFEDEAEEAVNLRSKAWACGIDQQVYEEPVIGLLARQASLTIALLVNPNAWTNMIAPLVLRSMIEAHVSLAWILLKPAEHAAKYREYGLGQLKLAIEKYKEYLRNKGKTEEGDELLQQLSDTLEIQQNIDLTVVNIGSWSGISFHAMAKEVQLPNMYDFSYSTHSSYVHSTWQALTTSNLRLCGNALHRHHFIPNVTTGRLNPNYIFDAVKYFNKSLVLFDERTGVTIASEYPLNKFLSELNSIAEAFKAAVRSPH